MGNYVSSIRRPFQTENGGFVEITVGVNKVRETTLKNAGKPVPVSVQTLGLIDTGATATALDSRLLDLLQLPLTNFERCRTPGGIKYPNKCIVKLSLPMENISWVTDYHECATFNNLGSGEFDVLIGLDVLSNFHFQLDGPNSHFQLLLPEVSDGSPIERPTLEGHAYFDPVARCFRRWEDEQWQPYHPKKRSIFSRLFG